MDITRVSTPNYTVGRRGQKIDKIVVHWIDGDISAADTVFSQSKYQVSAHFAVQDSRVHQYVKIEDTAWHAGNWQVNLTSVGIEHAGGPGVAISDETYTTSAILIGQICEKIQFPFSRGILHPHSEYYNTQCPGSLDLDRLASLVAPFHGDQEVGGITATLASAPSHHYSFQYNLSPGMVGGDVGVLQDALIALGVVEDVAAVQAGRGTYGPRTTQAVLKFQIEHQIVSNWSDYGAGYFGPKTRAIINSL